MTDITEQFEAAMLALGHDLTDQRFMTHALVGYRAGLSAQQAAQASQEANKPAAWIWKWANGEEEVVFVDAANIEWDPSVDDCPTTITPLYAAPAKAAMVPLTGDQLWTLWNSQGADDMNKNEAMRFARAIERAHGIGIPTNGGGSDAAGDKP